MIYIYIYILDIYWINIGYIGYISIYIGYILDIYLYIGYIGYISIYWIYIGYIGYISIYWIYIYMYMLVYCGTGSMLLLLNP